MSYDDEDETTIYTRPAPRYEPPSLALMLRLLELLASRGKVRLTIELATEETGDADHS